jgi:hypothetical protein
MTCVRRGPVDGALTDVQARKDPRRVEVLAGATAELTGLSAFDEARAASMADEGGASAAGCRGGCATTTRLPAENRKSSRPGATLQGPDGTQLT